jgi:hypothetical protein
MNIKKESKIDPSLAAGRDVPIEATQRAGASKFSGFFLTYACNTQFAIGSDAAKDFALELKLAVDDLIDHLHEYVIFNHGSLADVQNVESQAVIEQGANTGHVHAHIVLQFHHDANIKLDNVKIKAALNEALGIQGHFDNKLFRGNQAIKKYLEKTLLSY